MADQTIPTIKNLRGKIGIGLISPSTPLHVKGNIRAEASGSTAFADLKSSQIYASGTYDLIVGTNNPLFFRTNDERRMTILGDGKVGIGTTSPSVQLDIEGSSNVIADLNTTTANANTTIRLQENGSNKATIGYDGTNDGLILTTGGFTAGNGIFIDDNQNVGIGLLIPTKKLEVSSSGADVTTIKASYNTTNYLELAHNRINAVSSGGNDSILLQTAGTTRATINQVGLVTFAGTGGGALTIGSHIDLGDDQKLRLGASDDLQIYHDGNNWIDANGEGDLYLRNLNSSGDVVVQAGASGDAYIKVNSGETALKATNNGATELYYDDSKKFETTNDGATITGNLLLNSAHYVNFGDATARIQGSNASNYLKLYTGAVARLTITNTEATFSGDLVVSGGLTINGTTTTLNSTTLQVDDKNIELGTVGTPTDLTADGGGITLKGASDYTINWSNSTDSWHFNQGITVGANGTGHDVVFYGDTSDRYLTWDQSADKLHLRDNVKATFGNSDDLQIFHNGSNSYIREKGDGGLIVEG